MYYSVKCRKNALKLETLWRKIVLHPIYQLLVFVAVFFLHRHTFICIYVIPEIVQNNDCTKHKCPFLSIWHMLSLSAASILIRIIFVVYSNLQHCNYQPGNIIIFKLSLVSRCEKCILWSLPAHPCQKQLAQWLHYKMIPFTRWNSNKAPHKSHFSDTRAHKRGSSVTHCLQLKPHKRSKTKRYMVGGGTTTIW